jgi:hypothetical protein
MLRTVIASAAVVFAAGGLWLAPIEVPSSISADGKILPAREWTLVRDGDGSIGSLLHDHLRGRLESYSVSRFERGDAVRMRLKPGIEPRAHVTAGDTIAFISSNETERQLARLSGDLAATLASLDLVRSGEKAPVVGEAEMYLQRARERVRYQESELERLKPLHQRRLISAQDLEAAESQYRILEAEVAVAAARLVAVSTGAKPEQIELARRRTEALQREIETVQDRLEQFTVTAPLSGVVTRSFGADTLLSVRDTSAFLVIMPIRVSDHDRLAPGQPVTVRVPQMAAAVPARVYQLGDTVHLLGGEQVVLVTAVIERPPAGMMPGAFARCSIEQGRLPLRTYVKQSLFSPF